MNISTIGEQMDNRVEIKLVADLLKKEFNDVSIGGKELERAVYLCPPRKVVDDTTKILICDKKHKKVAVLICSFLKYSDLPERNFNYAVQIKKALGPEVGKIVLEPLFYGRKEGVSFAAWPYCTPISSNKVLKYIQLSRLKPVLFKWMKLSTKLTLNNPDDGELENDFLIPLTNLLKRKELGEIICNEIYLTIKKLNSGIWKPFFVMAHNDLWLNNILLKEKWWKEFVLIDWAGGRLKSYAIYDLVRISRDLNIPQKVFYNELAALCKILECEIEDSKSYLLSSLAHLGMNLDQFPENRYLELTKSCCNYLFSAVRSDNS